MRPSRPLPVRSQDIRSHRALLLPCLLALLPFAAAAQDPADTPVPQDHPYTLHVYTDLLQIPTLVLDGRGVPTPDLKPQDFQLQIDSGPVFRPSASHAEGNEPLSLALVLDASGEEKNLLTSLSATPGHGLPSALLPHDFVSIYAIDCGLVRSADDVPSDSAAARNGVARALSSAALHKPNAPTKTCRGSKHLWDAVAVAANSLSQKPGRRVLLVVSDGEDGGSKTLLPSLQQFVTARSIAVFALREPDDVSAPSPAGFGVRGIAYRSPPDLLESLTDDSGGLVLTSYPERLSRELERFVTLLRSRYILQFPRPASGAGGLHHLDVHVTHRGSTVRAAGIAVPVRDATLMNDPTTVPTDASKMPVIGNRKPVK